MSGLSEIVEDENEDSIWDLDEVATGMEGEEEEVMTLNPKLGTALGEGEELTAGDMPVGVITIAPRSVGGAMEAGVAL